MKLTLLTVIAILNSCIISLFSFIKVTTLANKYSFQKIYDFYICLEMLFIMNCKLLTYTTKDISGSVGSDCIVNTKKLRNIVNFRLIPSIMRDVVFFTKINS